MKKFKTVCLGILLLLCGCTPAPDAAPTQAAHLEMDTLYVAQVQEKIDPVVEAAALANAPSPSVILEAEAPGTLEERCGDAVIDYSNSSDGYVMVQFFTQTDQRLKVLVKGPTTTYSYNLPQEEWTMFPLSDGSGSYQIGVYQNVTGSKYATVLTANFEVQLNDEFAPFLRPNQYVNYTGAVETVAMGEELTRGISDPLEKVAAIYDYVVTNFTYDYDRAATVKSGYLPDLDQVLAEKKGICLDYAALMTAMLRSQGVPSKMVVGYAGDVYHSWISVWTDENGWIDGVIFFDGHVWKRMDPTFASSGNRSDEIMEFIENGSYTVKYLY